MAETDYDKYKVGSSVWQGGDDGDIIEHSTIVGPLTNAGTYGRLFRPTSLAGGGHVFALTGSSFIGVSNDNSISIRAWFRTNGVNAGAVGIVAKTDSGSAGFNSSTSFTPVGYALWLGRDASSAGAGNSFSFSYANGSTVVKDLSMKSVSSNSWLGMRMDVIPVVGTKDVVNIYSTTDDPDSPTWTLEKTYDILEAGTGYISWTSDRRIGFFAMVEGSGTGGYRYIDHIDFRVVPNE